MNKNFPKKIPSFIGKEKGEKQNNYWNVSDSISFSEGILVGELIAIEYLNYIRRAPTFSATLSQIIIDLSKHHPFSQGRRGQITGFFSTIESQIIQTTPSTLTLDRIQKN